MTERDTSTAGPVAYSVFAAVSLALGIWTIAEPHPTVTQWLQLVLHVALAAAFVVVAVRRVRARRSADPSA